MTIEKVCYPFGDFPFHDLPNIKHVKTNEISNTSLPVNLESLYLSTILKTDVTYFKSLTSLDFLANKHFSLLSLPLSLVNLTILNCPVQNMNHLPQLDYLKVYFEDCHFTHILLPPNITFLQILAYDQPLPHILPPKLKTLSIHVGEKPLKLKNHQNLLHLYTNKANENHEFPKQLQTLFFQDVLIYFLPLSYFPDSLVKLTLLYDFHGPYRYSIPKNL